ncbi:MAG TPA: cellulase family glycosylhydrolase, partial [Cytophagales bacterium]|nr:cellulase family glycosylhydrolase [Cytophagales bacterium]
MTVGRMLRLFFVDSGGNGLWCCVVIHIELKNHMIKYTLKSASKIQNFLSRKTIIIKIASILLLGSLYSARAQYPAGSPVAINGKLKLVGNKLSNECGNPVQLRGMSSHGIQWFGNCYNTSALDALANSWKVDLFRLAMYVQEGGYVNNPNYWKTWIDNMVDECGKRGIYCLIDWHVLTPGDPNVNLTQAREFWTYMSARHSGKKHVLYEICNEPNGVDWTRVKAYADDIIPRIRANDPATVIIVGTPNWSQDVDIAANNKLNYNNIMYALHFYTGTHTDWLRTKANTAMSRGIALFVTEFGTSLASGDGGPFLAEGQKWMDWMAANNISWANWSFCDKAEVSAALNSGACGSNWNNTSTSGTWIKQKLTTPADNFNCGGTGNQAPAVSLTTPSSGTTYTAPATITINATASDVDGNVAKVEFYSGATKLGEDLSSPYSYGWTHVPAGTYSIRAVAVDNLGATSSTAAASVTVTNNTVNKAPVVSITSPALGTSFDNNSNITFNAAASDPDGSITKVEFYNGTTKIGEDLSAPYAFTWRKVSAGTYYITAKATDNNGQTATSAVVVIKVGSTTGNVLPNVAITSPTAGSVFNAPAVINLAANATDVDGTIAKVEFYNGSVKIGEDLSSPYTYTWTGVMAGTYTLYAKAIDNIGGSASSQSISITVNTSTHTGCTTQAIPVAAEWQLRNPWSDQSNGSLVSNTAEALSIT